MLTKTCVKCNKEKPLNCFTIDRRSSDDYLHQCKDCLHIYRVKDYAINRERINFRRRQYQQEIKLEVFNHYTNNNIHCQCPSGKCTETHLEFMSIDHINGGGTKHRKIVGGSGFYTYIWLKKNNYPSGYRVLCYNCNCSRSHQKRCPHEFL